MIDIRAAVSMAGSAKTSERSSPANYIHHDHDKRDDQKNVDKTS